MIESDRLTQPPKKKLCGTNGDSYFWCSTSDVTGIFFATFVWTMILYAATVTLLVVMEGEMAVYNAAIILTLVVMALWSHLRTVMSDPGVIPLNAHPLAKDSAAEVIVCGRCECYRPPHSHHGKVGLSTFDVHCLRLRFLV